MVVRRATIKEIPALRIVSTLKVARPKSMSMFTIATLERGDSGTCMANSHSFVMNGSSYEACVDLTIPVSAVQAAGEAPATGRMIFLGGALRNVRGILRAVMAAVRAVHDRVATAHNAAEASLVPGARVKGPTCLADVLTS